MYVFYRLQYKGTTWIVDVLNLVHEMLPALSHLCLQIGLPFEVTAQEGGQNREPEWRSLDLQNFWVYHEPLEVHTSMAIKLYGHVMGMACLSTVHLITSPKDQQRWGRNGDGCFTVVSCGWYNWLLKKSEYILNILYIINIVGRGNARLSLVTQTNPLIGSRLVGVASESHPSDR